VYPLPGSLLRTSNLVLKWSAGAGATGYSVSLGDSGVGSKNLYNSGETKATSITIRQLPLRGETIYARLSTNFNGIEVHYDYKFKAGLLQERRELGLNRMVDAIQLSR
jgi:hypothetical protein